MKRKSFNVLAVAVVTAVLFANVSVVLNGTPTSYLKYGSIGSVFAVSGSGSGSDSGSGSGGPSLWFSNLNWVECPISKINGPVAFYYKGILIAAYAQYTVYGNKKVCERELTLNTCDTAAQTPCQEI